VHFDRLYRVYINIIIGCIMGIIPSRDYTAPLKLRPYGAIQICLLLLLLLLFVPSFRTHPLRQVSNCQVGSLNLKTPSSPCMASLLTITDTYIACIVLICSDCRDFVYIDVAPIGTTRGNSNVTPTSAFKKNKLATVYPRHCHCGDIFGGVCLYALSSSPQC